MAGDDRLESIERQLEEVLRRLEAVEGAPAEVEPEAASPPLPKGAGDVHGTLDLSGSIWLGERRLLLHSRVQIAETLAADPELVARVFAAMGSPFRILILRALLEGPRTSHELQTMLGVRAVGQLYHHLKELQAAGLIVQRRRSVYAMRGKRVVAVCIAFAAAARFLTGRETLSAADDEEPVPVEDEPGPHPEEGEES
ncbi:MAG: winged helix-turn-helix transcriptional regulator [Candidatus Dormibacteraeota bacterium]|nr:winged helix-turn-helix transcriptional regulator [Candidatus Dormibacteraeota bacterium]